MKIYIAGKISNDPDYRAKFADAQRQIERDQKVIAELREENERLTRRLFEPRPVHTTSTL